MDPRRMALGRRLPRAIAPPLVAVLAALFGLGCGPPPGAGEARALLARGDARAAERAAAEGLERAPDSRELWSLRIRAAMEGGDPHRAGDLYRLYRSERGGEDPRVLADMARVTLAQALSVPSPAVRARAIEIVETHELEELSGRVFELIGDADHQVAAAAAVAVLRAHPQAPAVATRMLESRDAGARALAAAGIARKVGQRARRDIAPLLDDPDPAVRTAAVRAIASWGASADTTRLAVAARDDDPAVRAAALRALGEGRRTGASALAFHALGSDQPAVRRAAAYALARLGHRLALERAAASADPVVALRAGAALWRLGHGDRDGIGRALRSQDPALRVAALAEIARSVPDRHGMRLAGWMLADPDPEVRLAAGRTLLSLGVHRRGTRAIEAALAAERADLRVIAAGELARLGDPRGLAALVELAGESDASVRRRAVRAHLVAGQLTAGLASALADPSPDIRLLAASAILSLSR